MFSRNTISIILFTVATLIFVKVFVFVDEPVSNVSVDVPSLSHEERGDQNTGQIISISKEDSVEELFDETTTESQPEILPKFTEDSLAVYNGQDPSLPIYVAFEGNVYDVTEGKKFYGPEGHYHFLAGTDGTKLLKLFGGETIKKKYPVVGTFNP